MVSRNDQNQLISCNQFVVTTGWLSEITVLGELDQPSNVTEYFCCRFSCVLLGHVEALLQYKIDPISQYVCFFDFASVSFVIVRTSSSGGTWKFETSCSSVWSGQNPRQQNPNPRAPPERENFSGFNGGLEIFLARLVAEISWFEVFAKRTKNQWFLQRIYERNNRIPDTEICKIWVTDFQNFVCEAQKSF